MLRWQLNNLIEDMPEVENVGITNDKSSAYPVTPVNQVVMVHVVPQILQSEFTIIIISVHTSLDLLVQIRIEES